MTVTLVGDVFFERATGGWYFCDRDLQLVGPYGTEQRAIDKLAEYKAYVVYAAKCHCHPPG